MLALKYHVHGEPGPINGDMYAWGGNHDQLLFHVNAAEANLRSVQPATTWTFSFPLDPVEVYWELDILNFGRILNGGAAADNAEYFFLNTKLNTVPVEAVYESQTKTKAQGSPRSTFPSSLGTDGQRLKAGRTKTEGAALNYIGKLFFLTSRTAFKLLWDSLKAGKISATEALAEANRLAKVG